MANFLKFLFCRRKKEDNIQLLGQEIRSLVGNINSVVQTIDTRLLKIEQLCGQMENEKGSISKIVPEINRSTSQTSELGSNQEMLQRKPSASQPALSGALPASQKYYLRTPKSDASFEVNNRISREDCFFEMKTQAGNSSRADLIPLVEKSAYLIMQRQLFLEPIFEISGNGNRRIEVDAPAKYGLQDNIWILLNKGRLRLT
jgi:hypothetical protein